MLDKTYRPADVEARIYARWETTGAFAPRRDPDAAAYCIVLPPPNVTGSLHIGHALDHTIQDTLIRFWRMRGRAALWQPGTDHAGIATQLMVERQLAAEGSNMSRREIGREAFLARVWQWKEASGGTISRQMRRLGLSPDWSRERFTMDEGLSRAVVRAFVSLHQAGLIYRDKRLVNWDPALQTAVSDLEVQQQEVDGHLWHLRYPLEGEPGRHLVVATTRPETMLGDTAVAVHPDDERYRDLVGRHVLLPLVGRRIPIVADPYSDPEKGSGAVKITPAHDFNDFEVGRRHGLEAISILNEQAQIAGEAPEAYRGLDRFEARKRVIADLEAQGLVEKIERYRHTVPHGDRSGVPLEPLLTDQWFCDAKSLAAEAIRAVEDGRTRFVPEQWAATYFEWMRNIQPWCVSRQLWWGHQIPAWYGPDGAPFVAETEEEARGAAVERYGREVELTRDPDVLDTWFSSALWPLSTLGWPEDTPELRRFYPTTVLVTGFDIIFFWVARMMMLSLFLKGEVPFRDVYMHGLVRDERGAKMSKTKGNVVDPLELIDEFGADALRYALVSNVVEGRDVKFGRSRITGSRNFVTKLWNAARFCELNHVQDDPAFEPGRCRHSLNRWIIGETQKTAATVTAALEQYRFSEAASALYHFIWDTFCDWYVELAKPLLGEEQPQARDETRAVAAWVLRHILHLLHPMAPFVTEELWRQLFVTSGGMLIERRWPELDPSLIDAEAEAELGWLTRAITRLRSAKTALNVPSSARLRLLVRSAGPATLARLDRHNDAFQRMLRLDGIEAIDGMAVPGALQVVVDEAVLALPLAGVIDLAREQARLAKEIARLDEETARLGAKLTDADFVERAPAEVVELQRERLTEIAAMRTRLAEALASIA